MYPNINRNISNAKAIINKSPISSRLFQIVRSAELMGRTPQKLHACHARGSRKQQKGLGAHLSRHSD
jgi:hypothetical protein